MKRISEKWTTLAASLALQSRSWNGVQFCERRLNRSMPSLTAGAGAAMASGAAAANPRRLRRVRVILPEVYNRQRASAWRGGAVSEQSRNVRFPKEYLARQSFRIAPEQSCHSPHHSALSHRGRSEERRVGEERSSKW